MIPSPLEHQGAECFHVQTQQKLCRIGYQVYQLRKSDVHRILQNPIYYGEFLWLGTRHTGVHDPLITRTVFEQVQAALRRKPQPSARVMSTPSVISTTRSASSSSD